ncbi:MAG: acyltransferase family protein, partial [Actinobacteria bacterium]|nr:acyltransferase family protein [Actinomycetota bacterium]
AEARDADGPATGRFYQRRVLRIVPAYWFALTVLSIYPLSQAMFNDWPIYYFFLQIYSPSFAGLGQAWTLCIEMTFYIALPGYAWVARKSFRGMTGRNRVARELLVLIVLSLVSAVFWRFRAHGDIAIVRVGLPHYFYWFALGMALALVSVWGHDVRGSASGLLSFVRRRPSASWAIALVLFVILCAFSGVPAEGVAFPPLASEFRWVLQPLIAFFLIAPAVFSEPGTGLPGRFLVLRPVAWLGLVSYGIYLWHQAAVDLLFNKGILVRAGTPVQTSLTALVLVLAITIPCAALSYYLVERRFLKLKESAHLLAQVRAALQRHFLAAAAAIAVASGLIVAFVIRSGWFVTDDFRNLNDAHHSGLTLQLLNTPLIGDRYSPGHRFLDWLVLQWPGHEWGMVVAISAGCIALATFLVAVLVRQITNSSLVPLAAAAAFGSWSGWMVISLWWAASAHILPMTAMAVAALAASVRWDRGRRWYWFVAALVLMGASCAFSVRAALLPLVLFALLAIAQPAGEDFSLRSFGRRTRSVSWLFAPMIVVAAIAVLKELGAGLPSNAAAAPLTQWMSFLWHWMVDEVAVTAVNGFPTLASSPSLTSVVGVVTLSLFAAATIRNRRSAFIWIAMLGLLLLAGAQVFYSRHTELGLGVINVFRYSDANLMLMAVFIPAAWVASGRPMPQTAGQRTLLSCMAILFAIIWLSNGVSTEHRARVQEPGAAAAGGFERLRESLTPLAGDPEGASLIDERLPPVFQQLPIAPDWQLPGLVRIFLPELNVRRLSDRGVPVALDPWGNAHELLLGRQEPVNKGDRFCLSSMAGSTLFSAGSAARAFPLPPGAGGLEMRVLTIHLARTAQPGALGLVFKPSANNLPNAIARVDRDSTGIRIVMPVGASNVTLLAWGGLSTCVRSAAVSTALWAP